MHGPGNASYASASPTAKTVLIYKSTLLPWSETFIKDQILALKGWRGVLVGERHLAQLSLDGLDVCLLRPDKLRLIDRAARKFTRLIGAVPRLTVKRLCEKRASLLHVHFGTDAVCAWPIARALNLPMLVTLHGFDINVDREWWEAGHGGHAMRNYPARLLKLARQPGVSFIAVSEAIRRRAVSYGIPANKTAVQYIGVDTSTFTANGRPILEREPRVLFVGRLIEKKGCEYLIRAFAPVQRAVPEARLVIVGDGPLRESLQRLALEFDVRAEFCGVLSAAEVREQLNLARVFCLPSVQAANGDAEGFGLVILEAQASGVPVVTSALGGSTEGISEGVTGYSFVPRDVHTLTTRLIRLLTDDAVAAAFAEAGPRFVAQNFDLFQRTEELEAAYDKQAAGLASTGKDSTSRGNKLWSAQP
jgi:glycosyltransferase involved in cell wall biosynthesis